MEIRISEDNGFLFGGVPTLVVVSVCFDNGKQVRFPYQAEKAISALYKDLARVNVDEVKASPAELVMRPELQSPMKMVFSPKMDLADPVLPDVGKPNEIEREDIVTCVKVEDRGQGATVDLHVGGIYRVIKVHAKDLSMGEGIRHIIDGYDVVDDNAPTQFRTYVYAHEVALHQKHKARPKKFLTKEVDLKCSKCGEVIYCGLKDGIYGALCECGQWVSQPKDAWDAEHPLPGKAAA